MRHLDRSAPLVPADHGLACLGLLLQLAGNVFAALAVIGAFATVFTHHHGDDGLWFVLVLTSAAARSLALRAAGTRLVYGDRAHGVPGPAHAQPPDEKRLGGIQRYVVIAIAQAALVASVAAAHFHASAGAVVAVLAALLVWPVVLAIVVTRPSIHALGRRLPATADMGFESVAIVMTVLAGAGLVLALALLGAVFDLPAGVVQQGPALMAIVLLGALVVRSVVHLQAGIVGLRETSIDRACRLATRYADFGVISTFCAGAVLLLSVAVAQLALAGVTLVAGLVWMLMAWPLAVRRFFRDRQFDDLLAGDDAIAHHRAPDAGLSGLGWLVAGTSAISLSWLLIGLARNAIPAPPGPLVLHLAVVALGSCAATELVCMTRRARLAAIVWAVACAGVALYVVVPDLVTGFGIASYERERWLGPGWLVGEIVLSAVCLALVTRRLAPAARARYRRS